MRKLGAIMLRVFAGLILGIVGLVLLVWIAAQLPVVRQAAGDQLLSAVRNSINGRLQLEDVRWPRFDRIELSGVRLYDRTGQLVLDVSSITADLRLRPLLWGQIEVTSLDIEHPVLRFEPSSEQRGLLSVFGANEPSEPEVPKSALSPVVIDVEQVCLARGRVELQLSERQLALRHFDACLGLRVGDTLELALQRLAGELLVQGQPVLRVASEEAPDAQLATAVFSGKLRTGGTAQLAFDARLHARGLSARTLEALQLPADWLQASLALEAHATQKDEVLRARARVGAGDDWLELLAHLDAQKQLQTELKLDQLSVARLTSFDLPPLSADARVRASLGSADTQVQLRVPYALYGDLPLPRLFARATFGQGGQITVPELRASYGAAQLHARAHRGAGGALHASAELNAPELASLPPLEQNVAKLRGSAHAQLELDRSAGGELAFTGSLRLQDAAFEAQRVQSLKASWDVAGELERPRVQLRAEADGLTLAERAIPRAELDLSGGPRSYTLQLRAPRTRALHAFAHVRRESDGGFRGELRCGAQLGHGELAASASGVRFQPGHALSVGALEASYLGARLHGSGTVGLGGRPSRAQAQLQLPLRPVSEAYGVAPIDGQLSAKLRLRGTLEHPRVRLETHLWDGPRLAGHRLRGQLQGELDLGTRRANLQLGAAAGPARVSAELKSRLAVRQALDEAVLDGHNELQLDAAELSFAALRKLGALPPAEVLHGSLATQLHLQGNLRALSADNHWQIELRDPGGAQRVRLNVDADYKASALQLEAHARDGYGELLGMQAGLHANLERALSGELRPRELVAQRPWDIELHVAQRSLGELPGMEALGMGPALRSLQVAADTSLRHEPRTEPQGKLSLRLAMPAHASACGGAGPGPKLRAAAELEAGRLSLQLSGKSRGQEVFKARSAGSLSLASLLNGERPELPRHISATLERIQLADLPFVCERGRGLVSAEVALDDLFRAAPQLRARVRAEQLSWGGSPSLSGQARAWIERSNLRLQSELRPGAGRAQLAAQLPVQFLQQGGVLDVQPQAPLSAQLQLDRVDLGALLAFVPGVARPSGRIDGQVSLAGTLDHPLAYGSVTLDDVAFTLPRAAQRVSNLHARATASGRTLKLSELEVHDLGGVARARATLSLPSLAAWSAKLELSAHDFPVRKSGVLVGYVDADASVRAEADAQRLDLEARLRNMSVALTGNTGAELQSLEPNPDIVFASELGVRDTSNEEQGSGLAASLHILTSEPAWVRRSDFAVLMSADIRVDIGQAGPSLRGTVELERGYVSLLGQSFDIQRGRVTFTGGSSVDPQLQLTAVQNGAGKNVKVEVSGFVHKPEVTFFVADKPVTAGQAVLALTGSPTDDGNATASAQNQVASAAIGMTTGLLSLAARQEFGDWVPMLQIDTGQRTRVRVGFDADRLIPKFLRGFVRGAYVEGLIASSSDVTQTQSGYASSSTRALPGGGGVLIELMLPADWVWAGQYGPGNTWSIDLNWRP